MTAFRPFLITGLAVVSIFSVVLGARGLLAFDHGPGEVGSVPARWPSASAVERRLDGPELLVFLHPSCSCSVATVNEIRSLGLSAMQPRSAPEVTMFFAGMSREESQSSALWKQARQIPGAHVIWDEEGRESKLFGALTSGIALLYSSRGELLFHGGVTGSRGHEGDNYGLARLAEAIRTGREVSAPGFVFGCALFGRRSGL